MRAITQKIKPVKHRKIALVITAVLVLALVLSGTYAWVSISQIAYNEASGKPNPGGRIHDDYDGENKDVYAENFGSAPLFVRVRLSEYFEIGSGAGLKSLDGGNTANPDNLAKSLQVGASIDHKETWATHTPKTASELCEIGDPNNIHKYVAWTMGGSKVFMPTFNKDLNDLSTDASGLAIDADNMSATAVGRDDALGDKNDGSHNYWLPHDKVTTDELRWDATANSGAGAVVTVPDITHLAKNTLLPDDVGVMTMEEWKTNGSKLGNYWVYDSDGWAYWANPLLPGRATSLLLNNISVTEPDQDWYYCIDVEGQFATELDIAKFGEDGMSFSPNAQALLDAAIASLAPQATNPGGSTPTPTPGSTPSPSPSPSPSPTPTPSPAPSPTPTPEP